MGTFEKLGILVIVVIIVMILAVAIYQWGGAGSTPGSALDVPGGLTVKTIDDLRDADANAGPRDAARENATPVDSGMWPGGIPKRHTVAKDDKVWVLVFERWGLKESFIQEIERANPKIDFKRLRPGMEIVVPDPAAFKRSTAEKQAAPAPKTGGVRLYEIQGGDTLESIADTHLGSGERWREIMAMNPGLDPKRISEGREIYLPVK